MCYPVSYRTDHGYLVLHYVLVLRRLQKMNFKLNGLVTAMVVAVGMTTFVGTASAQGIPGTFFAIDGIEAFLCLLYTSPSPRD